MPCSHCAKILHDSKTARPCLTPDGRTGRLPSEEKVCADDDQLPCCSAKTMNRRKIRSSVLRSYPRLRRMRQIAIEFFDQVLIAHLPPPATAGQSNAGRQCPAWHRSWSNDANGGAACRRSLPAMRPAAPDSPQGCAAGCAIRHKARAVSGRFWQTLLSEYC